VEFQHAVVLSMLCLLACQPRPWDPWGRLDRGGAE